MNDKNKKEKNSPIGLIIAAFIIFGVIGEADSAAAGVLIFLAIVAVAIFVIVRAAKSQAAAKGDGKAAPVEFSPEAMKKVAKESFSKVMTEAKKYAETADCEDDHEHVEPDYNMSADEKRRQQLKSMLANGLIEKEEYNIMLRRYGLK